MMEMAKTLATIFRLFRFDRETEEPSETREGFIVKIAECRVRISLRD
jgi:benzoate 4-monooxygenase